MSHVASVEENSDMIETDMTVSADGSSGVSLQLDSDSLILVDESEGAFGEL